jgi:hypothetical protein
VLGPSWANYGDVALVPVSRAYRGVDRSVRR